MSASSLAPSTCCDAQERRPISRQGHGAPPPRPALVCSKRQAGPGICTWRVSLGVAQGRGPCGLSAASACPRDVILLVVPFPQQHRSRSSDHQRQAAAAGLALGALGRPSATSQVAAQKCRRWRPAFPGQPQRQPCLGAPIQAEPPPPAAVVDDGTKQQQAKAHPSTAPTALGGAFASSADGSGRWRFGSCRVRGVRAR